MFKKNLAISIFSILLVVFSFEIYLEFSYLLLSKKNSQEKIDKLDELNEDKIKFYSNMYPNIFVHSNGLKSNKSLIFPLGGISNVNVLNCKESDYWSTFETDEHGFNNPKLLYYKKIDVMLIGDSFTEGSCVKSEEVISSVMRKNNIATINLGRGSNGPLIELALLMEYAKPLKPKNIIWLYYENDIRDLSFELSSPFLNNYLNKENFSQNLISRQNEIDVILKKY